MEVGLIYPHASFDVSPRNSRKTNRKNNFTVKAFIHWLNNTTYKLKHFFFKKTKNVI